MKHIPSIFVQPAILLLLAFACIANIPISLFTTAATGADEVVQIESSLDDIDDLSSNNNLEGGDDDTCIDNYIFSQHSLASYPFFIMAGQPNNRLLHPPVPFYILYKRFIFYHPGFTIRIT